MKKEGIAPGSVGFSDWLDANVVTTPRVSASHANHRRAFELPVSSSSRHAMPGEHCMDPHRRLAECVDKGNRHPRTIYPEVPKFLSPLRSRNSLHRCDRP